MAARLKPPMMIHGTVMPHSQMNTTSNSRMLNLTRGLRVANHTAAPLTPPPTLPESRSAPRLMPLLAGGRWRAPLGLAWLGRDWGAGAGRALPTGGWPTVAAWWTPACWPKLPLEEALLAGAGAWRAPAGEAPLGRAGAGRLSAGWALLGRAADG